MTVEKPPISRILEHYGALFVPTGGGWKRMRCPFQDEDRNPSASVNTILERFACFACTVNEDAYGLVMWRGDASDFVGAKQFIEDLYGERYGDVPPESDRGRRPGRRRVFDDPSPLPGQRSIIPPRIRRQPFTGA